MRLISNMQLDNHPSGSTIPKAYEKADFKRIDPHWLSGPEAERSIFGISLD